MSEQPPSALDAAGTLLNKLDSDHITEVRAASWAIAVTLIAEHLRRYAGRVCEQRVSDETERCAKLVEMRAGGEIRSISYGPDFKFPEDVPEVVNQIRGAAMRATAAEIRAPAERPAPEGPQPNPPSQAGEGTALASSDPLTEVLRNLPLNHASDDQIRAEYQRRGLAPSSPAAVPDYTERARELLTALNDTVPPGIVHPSRTMAQLEILTDAFSAVASEHQAARSKSDVAFSAALDRREAVIRQREAEIAALREQVNFFQVQYQDEIGLNGMREERDNAVALAKSALLARLLEPDEELVVAVGREISPQRWANLNAGEEEREKAIARAALTKIAEMVK